MQTGVRTRCTSVKAAFAAILVATCCRPEITMAEENAAAIIAPPVFNNSFAVTRADSFATLSGRLGNSINDSASDLQRNLDILANLNTRSNQEALDAFASAHGAPGDMGSRLSAAISNINATQMKDDTQALAKNVKGMLGDYDQTFTSGAAAYRNGNMNAQDPKARSLLSSGASLGHELGDMSGLNKNMGLLNANVASINQTYINLLKLSSEDPSKLANISDLSDKLNAFNKLSDGTLAKLSEVNKNIVGVNNSFGVLDKSGGITSLSGEKAAPAFAALQGIHTSVTALNGQLSDTNDEMSTVLGNPKIMSSAQTSQIK